MLDISPNATMQLARLVLEPDHNFSSFSSSSLAFLLLFQNANPSLIFVPNGLYKILLWLVPLTALNTTFALSSRYTVALVSSELQSTNYPWNRIFFSLVVSGLLKERKKRNETSRMTTQICVHTHTVV